MASVKNYIVFLALTLLTGRLGAQNITGTWEGDMGDEQFLQLNIIQNGNKLCGYTWDYIKNGRSSYCKAYFEGYYYKKDNEWIVTGTQFFENSGSHSLMRLKFTLNYVRGRGVLEGISSIKASLLNFFGLGAPDSIFLVKVSSRPQKIIENMRDCFLEEQKPVVKKKPADTIAKIPPPPPVINKTDSAQKEKPKDTIVKITPPLPVIIKKDSPIKAPPVVRKNKEQSRIEVNEKKITLNVYDNAMVDDDTVSIFYNGRLLISHQRLSAKPIVIELELDEKVTRHEITMFAENLGSIPPNTALIVIYAGDKRYELFSSASLEENAVLVFEYKPKPK